jgi:hypothetical protein
MISTMMHEWKHIKQKVLHHLELYMQILLNRGDIEGL